MNTKKICDKIFLRENLNKENQQKNTPFFTAVSSASERLKKLPMKQIAITSHDGLTLHGKLRETDNAKRIILALHGYSSSWDKDFSLISEHLFNSECTVVFAEQRAHGKSEGDFTTLGTFERYDCISWIDYIITNISSSLPVYIYGMSMGASTAIMAAGKILPTNVHGIIADSPGASPVETITIALKKRLPEKTDMENLTEKIDTMLRKRFGFSLYDYSVTEALKSLSRPLLLLHGEKDSVTPCAMSEEIFRNCKGAKMRVVFENSKHLQGVFDESEKYKNALDVFFNLHDKTVFSKEPKLNYPEKTMFQIVKEAADRLPNDAAYNFEGKITSYKKMIEKIEKTARAFLSMGIKENDVVTICMPNTPQAVESLYALNRIGAVASFIHPLSAVKEISYYLNLSQSKAIIVPDLFYENVINALKDVKQSVKVIVARIQDELPSALQLAYIIKKGKDYLKFPDNRGGTLWKDFIKQGTDSVTLPPIVYNKNKNAVILFSGGTTGVSKGICLSDLNFNALAMQARIAMNCEFSRGLKNLSAMPIFHGFGLGIGIHTVLTNNACCILLPRFNTKIYAEAMKKRKPDFIAGVPTIFKMLVECDELKDTDLSYLKGMFVGGDSMPVELKKKVDTFLRNHGALIQVREGYGLTECVTASCLTPKDTHKEGSIGLPFPDTLYKIVTPTTENEVPRGEDGEIIISGPTVMLGYLNNEDETQFILRRHSDGRIWLHTGDLGFIDNDGYIYFRQRIKRMIITSGYNVYPSQVEKAIESHPDVDYCCVIGVEDSYKMEKIKAFIVTQNGVNENDELKNKIREHCRMQIAGYAIPKEIEFRKELPKTLVGKVAYKKLEESEKKNK